jgi:hypothetical protein
MPSCEYEVNEDRLYHTLTLNILIIKWKAEKYHTVGTVQRSNRKIPPLLEQFKDLIEKYNTVGTVQRSNRKIPHCWNSSKI